MAPRRLVIGPIGPLQGLSGVLLGPIEERIGPIGLPMGPSGLPISPSGLLLVQVYTYWVLVDPLLVIVEF